MLSYQGLLYKFLKFSILVWLEDLGRSKHNE